MRIILLTLGLIAVSAFADDGRHGEPRSGLQQFEERRDDKQALWRETPAPGAKRTRRPATVDGCEELILPEEQRPEQDLTGYFNEDRARPFFMASFRLGLPGSGRLAFVARLSDGELPEVAKAPQVNFTVQVPRNGRMTTFQAVSGELAFSVAQQNPKRGQFTAEMTGLKLVEMDGETPRPGGACLRASSFSVTGAWNSPGR